MTKEDHKKPYIQVENLTKIFWNTNTCIFQNFNLELSKKNTALFGPNGCGKTTLLRILAGLDMPSSGKVYLRVGEKSNKIKIGYAFQDPTKFLFPWMTNLENVAFPLKIKGFKENEIWARVNRIMEQFQLTIPLNAYPYQISSGQCQILVVLRSLIDSPDILLLDEPFSNLDYLNRTKFLINLIHNTGNQDMITIFVSHTLEEGILLADELILLGGKPTTVIKKLEIPINKEERNYSVLNQEKFLKIKQEALKIYQECL